MLFSQHLLCSLPARDDHQLTKYVQYTSQPRSQLLQAMILRHTDTGRAAIILILNRAACLAPTEWSMSAPLACSAGAYVAVSPHAPSYLPGSISEATLLHAYHLHMDFPSWALMEQHERSFLLQHMRCCRGGQSPARVDGQTMNRSSVGCISPMAWFLIGIEAATIELHAMASCDFARCNRALETHLKGVMEELICPTGRLYFVSRCAS